MSDPAINAAAFNAFEAAGWQEIAHAYDRFFGRITARVIDPLLDAAGVGAGTRLLDVATGPGYVAGRAAERGAAVTGVDIASAMVALARERHATIDFRQGDAERLPFEDAAFDAVVANFVVLHLGRPERAAGEATRVLAPGGRAAFSMWDTPDRARVFGVILEAIADAGAAAPADIPEGPPFFRFSDDAAFAALLTGAGLADVAVETIAFSQRIESAQEIWDGFVDGTARTRWLILAQPPEVRTRIREALDDRLRPYERDGGFDVPIAVKIASGRRP